MDPELGELQAKLKEIRQLIIGGRSQEQIAAKLDEAIELTEVLSGVLSLTDKEEFGSGRDG